MAASSSHEDRIVALSHAVTLSHAVAIGGDPTSQVIPAARAFAAFLAGDEGVEGGPARSPVEKVGAGLDAASPQVDAGSHPTADIPVAAGMPVQPAAKPTPPAAAKPAPAPDGKAAAKPPTQDEVREALKEYAKREGQDAAMEILAKYASTNITKLDERHYADVVKDCAPF